MLPSLPSFAILHAIDSPNFLAIEDQLDVGSLSCPVTFKPVSEPLQPSIRFFQPPKLACLSVDLTINFPQKGRHTRFPRSTEEGGTGLGACSRPASMLITRQNIEIVSTNLLYLLVQVYKSLPLVIVHDPYADSLMFTMPVA